MQSLSPRTSSSSSSSSSEPVVRGTFPAQRLRPRLEGLTPPARAAGPPNTVGGSKELTERTGHIRATGESISLYPPGCGDPICDAFEVFSDGDVSVAALADGCGWGERKREAARRASSCFVGAVQEGLAAVRDVREVAGLLQRAVLAAHADIVRGYAADVFQAGTACLAGLAVLPCGENEMQHGACLVAVGNVHAFLVRAATGVVLELTAGSLSGAKNPNDTCGRLGPYVDGGDPDLRNLQRYFCECREGDWIWLVTDSVVRNCDVAALLDASPLSGSRVLRACEERTAELRGFLAASPSAAAPPHLSGVLDHATALGLCVGRPPVAAALAEGGVEAPLSGAEGLPGAAELRWSEADWSRVFVCLPPYAAATGPRLEVRAQLLTVAVPDAQHGVLRPRAIGWLALTEGMSRKQLSRWLSRTISTSMQQQQQQQQQQSAQPQLQQSSNSSDLLRDLVPERDTLQLLGRGRTATDRFGVVISDVVVEVIGRDNSLIATRRLVLAASPDPARVKEFLNSLPASFRPIPSVFDFAQSFLVPSAEKYK